MMPIPRLRRARILICLSLLVLTLPIVASITEARAEAPRRDITMALRQDEPILDFLLRFKLDTAEAIAISELIDQALPMPERQSGVIVQVRLNYASAVVEIQSMQIESMTGRSISLRRAGPLQYLMNDKRLGIAAPAANANSIATIGKPSDTAESGDLRHIHAIGGNDVAASLMAAGAPEPITAEVLKVFGAHKALTPEALKRATVEVVYTMTEPAQLLAAGAEIDGRAYRLWRFAPSGKAAGYFDENGERVDALALQAPIVDGRITSPWGMRKHPVLRDMRFHKGVDYEAQAGTPVYAAADGVVTEARRLGNYGIHLKIAHSDRIATTYAHLLKIEPAVKPGTAVKRGDVVAYVGRSGLATGPHLYFEVTVDNKRVDPARWVGQGGGDRLSGQDLAAFHQLQRRTAPAARIGRRAF